MTTENITDSRRAPALTDADLLLVRDRVATGKGAGAIARELGISRSTLNYRLMKAGYYIEDRPALVRAGAASLEAA